MSSRILPVVLLGFVSCVFAASSLCAQSVGSRNSNWSPFRPLQVAQHTEPSDEVIMEGSPDLENCEPCPPIYGEYISDSDLQQMRGCRSGYVMQPAAQQMMAVPMVASPSMGSQSADTGWGWEVLPSDVIWHSYMAGPKESRMSGTAFQELNSDQTLLDVTLGGRASILRYGTRVNGQPYGWELQIEGAGMPRLNLDENWDLESADFRFGMPLIYGNDIVQFKFSYYHLSSHLGDEYILRQGIPASDRINYSRDALVLGASIFPLPAWRWYGEMEWAFYADEGADPWAFQCGVEYAQPGPTGAAGTPFFAVNGLLRQEVDFGGTMTAQAGWLWRGVNGKMLRTGVHYQNGKTNQLEFSDEFEQQIGAGLWYDF
jgi:hypothetical protein